MPVVSQHFFIHLSLFLPPLPVPSPVWTSLEILLSVAELTVLQCCLCHSDSRSPCCLWGNGGLWNPPQPHAPHRSCLLQCHSGVLLTKWGRAQPSLLFPLPGFPGVPVGDWGSVWILFWSDCRCASSGSLFLPASLLSLLCQKLASPSKLPAKLFAWPLPNLSQSQWTGSPWTVQISGLC